jgi:hypothetical protein
MYWSPLSCRNPYSSHTSSVLLPGQTSCASCTLRARHRKESSALRGVLAEALCFVHRRRQFPQILEPRRPLGEQDKTVF